MKFIHMSDLHIGKRVNGFSMIDDQKYILDKIIKITEEEKPDAILIAGDVYDKPTPSNEAVDLYDSFICKLAEIGSTIAIISGNHDSAHFLSCAGKLMEKNKVYISPVYSGHIDPVVVEDANHKTAKIWLLPFVKPVHVRRYFEEAEINNYTDALKYMIEECALNPQELNIAVVHQFISGGSVCDSEEMSVGGLDNVEASVFDPFDYVALGHLHGEQRIEKETIRYAGSPLKYSFSEMKQKKGLTVVEIAEKGNVEIRQIPLVSKREMVEIRGTFEELISRDFLKGQNTDDYYHIILTDEQDIPNAASRLRNFYPNWMVLEYDNTRTRTQIEIGGAVNVKQRSPLDIFRELYMKQMKQDFNEFQEAYLKDIMEDL